MDAEEDLDLGESGKASWKMYLFRHFFKENMTLMGWVGGQTISSGRHSEIRSRTGKVKAVSGEFQ